MATPIGTNEINSLSRRFIMPQVVDNIYGSNLMFFRLVNMNKKMLQGGLQIEVPLNYTRFTAGGSYQGFDVLDIAPQDTVKNAAFDWKQYYVPVSVDGLTLIRADSPEAVVNFLTFYFENAQTELSAILGTDVWSDGSSSTKISGFKGAVDDGTVLATYGGLLRSSNTWWESVYDSSTTTLTLASMRTMLGNTGSGGRQSTLIAATQANYNRFWALCQTNQAFPSEPAGRDEQLASAGFRNLIFDGIPIVVDSGVPANHIFYLNEDYIYLYVNPREDFTIRDFKEPINQNAMTSLIFWAGQLVLSNVARQGKQTAVAA